MQGKSGAPIGIAQRAPRSAVAGRGRGRALTPLFATKVQCEVSAKVRENTLGRTVRCTKPNQQIYFVPPSVDTPPLYAGARLRRDLGLLGPQRRHGPTRVGTGQPGKAASNRLHARRSSSPCGARVVCARVVRRSIAALTWARLRRRRRRRG
eukprot:scaffold63626_cov63-Phaeocystis_antarctica.AAC.2